MQDGRQVIWPPLRLAYLFQVFIEVGPILNTEMGRTPIGWREIEAYQAIIGFDFRPWEAKILRAASTEYLAQMQSATKADCPPPGVVVNNDPETMAKHIKNTLRG